MEKELYPYIIRWADEIVSPESSESVESLNFFCKGNALF